MAGPISSISAICPWLVSTSQALSQESTSEMETIKREFTLRIAQRTDLTAFDRTTVHNLGSAILQSDLGKLQAILKSYRHYPEQFAQLAYILACELQCPTLSILRISVIPWKAGGSDSEHGICVLTLRLERARRFIDVSTDSNYGVHVYAVTNDEPFAKLVKVNESPRTVLKKINAVPLKQPEAILSAWWN